MMSLSAKAFMHHGWSALNMIKKDCIKKWNKGFPSMHGPQYKVLDQIERFQYQYL